MQDTSQLLLHHLRSTDIVARIGGDEFAVVMQGTASEEILNHKISQIQTDFSSQLGQKYGIALSMSVGAVCYPMDGENYRELMERADSRLREEKKNKKRVLE